MFLTAPLPSSDVLSLPLLFPVSDTSSVPPTTPRPLHIYTRRPHTNSEPPTDSSPMTPSSITLVLPSPANLPITIRKGNHSSRNPHPIYSFLTYRRLHHILLLFPPSSISLPASVQDALSHLGWKHAMVEEMVALHSTGTWDLVSFPAGKSHVGCHWVYTVRIGLNGPMDCLKPRLVAKGYT